MMPRRQDHDRFKVSDHDLSICLVVAFKNGCFAVVGGDFNRNQHACASSTPPIRGATMVSKLIARWPYALLLFGPRHLPRQNANRPHLTSSAKAIPSSG